MKKGRITDHSKLADVFFKSHTNSRFEEIFDHNSITLYSDCQNILGEKFNIVYKKYNIKYISCNLSSYKVRV